MADRGGLNYPIKVRDEFSKTTALFRKELRASKKEFRDFQKALKGQGSSAKNIRDQAKAIKELAKAQRDLGSATKRSQKPMTDAERFEKKRQRTLQNLKDQSKLLADQEVRTARTAKQASAVAETASRNNVALKQKLAKAAEREAERVTRAAKRQAAADLKLAQSKSVEFQANKRNNAELFRKAVALKQIELLKNRAKQQFGAGDFTGGTETLRRAKGLEKSLKTQVGHAQKLLFTFRRLVGTLAIFTLARKGLQAFNDLVKSGIKFNDTVANAQLGIAGLVITLGDVRDAQGQSVDATEQLSLALGVAREQTAKLRQDSLKTVATFEQLLDTFQVSVGPGLAAGLNLDEVRKLTVDISQAAAALGVPQNQLAEEVRSLLSGTIQARTTRIATALGISNEDVRRLKETGELFDFLEERFAGFAEAAERQARTTFTGITTLIKGLVQEILGESARPLFEELISLGNDLFDNFLSIRDAAGNIKPGPEVVAAFQQVFDALKRSIEAFRELGTGAALNALEATMAGIAITIDFISGAVTQLVSLFSDLSGVVQEVSKFLGITSENAGTSAALFGKWLVNAILIQKALAIINLTMLRIAGIAGVWLAAFVVVGKAVEYLLEKIFGVDLGLRDTIQLITTGLLGAWFSVIGVLDLLVEKITSGLSGALDFIITEMQAKARSARGFIQALFGDEDAKERAEDFNSAEKVLFNARKAAREAEQKVALQDIKDQTSAKLEALNKEIAATVGARAGENAKGEGFRAGFDPAKAARDAAEAAKSFVSTANRSVSDLGESLAKVNQELIKAEQLFSQAQRSQGSGGAGGVGGLAGRVESAFNKEEVAAAERLRRIQIDLVNVERNIAQFREIGSEAAGALTSALKDQEILQNAIANAEEQSLQLAGLRAATIATQALPALREEAIQLRAQVAAERARTAAITARAGDRALALVSAQTALELSKADLATLERKNALELQSLQNQATKLSPGAQLDALNDAIAALENRRDLEEEILRLQVRQLETARQDVELVQNGSIADGARQGLLELRDELPTIFETGLELTKQIVTDFADFAATEIVGAIINAQQDGVSKTDLFKQAAGRFIQQFATQLMQTAINGLIKRLLQALLQRMVVEKSTAQIMAGIKTAAAAKAAAIDLMAAKRSAAIRGASAGFHSGGLVKGFNSGGKVGPEHYSRKAVGLAAGGPPPGIHPSDTIPAWLTPGEFVMTAAATSRFLPLLQGMNGGNMPVVGSASAEAASPSVGMADGGMVSDRVAQGGPEESPDNSGGGVILPVLVADDQGMDRLTAGGRNAFFEFMREDAGTINALLGRE